MRVKDGLKLRASLVPIKLCSCFPELKYESLQRKVYKSYRLFIFKKRIYIVQETLKTLIATAQTKHIFGELFSDLFNLITNGTGVRIFINKAQKL